ncbi:MAG: fumarylacetoacetate hydrolase family protein [Chthonomonadales bacterium]
MKLVRFDAGDGARIGVLNGEPGSDGARVVDLEAAARILGLDRARFPQSMRAFLAEGSPALEAAKGILERFQTMPLDPPAAFSLSSVRLCPPVGDPGKIICVGQNYRDHCEEQHRPIPARPIIFAKFATALIGPHEAIRIPKLSNQVDYEAELAFVIGAGGRYIAEADAMRHIAGYVCFNDVSARDIQFGDGQWVRGKSFDTFAPTGPALVTPDEVSNPHELDIRLTLNGRVMQQSNTRNLVFGVGYLVSFLSQVMTLEPGDIISTGTPGGVGVFRDPPVFLKPGDVVEVSIDRVGTLTNPVAAEKV